MKPCAVIVIPAFYAIHTPSLGGAIVKSIFETAGFSTRVQYANIDLWNAAPEAYETLLDLPHELLLGEWLFGVTANRALWNTAFNFGEALGELFASSRNVEHMTLLTEPCLDRLKTLYQSLDAHLDRVVAEILATSPTVVAFSSSFHQTSSAVAIANRLKLVAPRILTILGGANAEGPMGEALLGFGVFDFVFSGQAEHGLQQLLSSIDNWPKGVFKADGTSQSAFLAQTPDYSDYFRCIELIPFQHHVERRLPLHLPIETSRGCWWGQSHHCTFCGLNGATMLYRKKDPSQVIEEISQLALRWQQDDFSALDNIMPTDAVVGYVEALQSRHPGLQIFFEVKANLSERRLDELAAVGVRAIQPGIESLSTSVLKKIDKGLTALEAVRLLRDCEVKRIKTFWNAFTEIPDDNDEDYSGLSHLVESIVHLQPPTGYGPIRVDRFSPYFMEPARYGIRELNPFPVYSKIFEGSGIDIEKLAYHFEFDRLCPLTATQPARRAFTQALAAWKRAWRTGYQSRPRLRTVVGGVADGAVLVEDTRPCAIEQYFVLECGHKAVLAAALHGATDAECGDLQVLGELIERRFIAMLDGKYLTLLTDYPSLIRPRLQ